jgi:hypothetical protein
VFSGLSVVFGLLAAGLLALAGIISIFSEADTAGGAVSLLGMAWIGVFAAGLAVPSLLNSLRQLLGRPLLPWFSLSPANGFRLSGLLLLVWPLVLLLGNLVSGSAQIAWLLLPPLQLLAVGIPTWWFIEMARSKLRVSNPGRSWGLVNFSVFFTTPLLILVETVGLVILLVGFGVWAGFQPQLLTELQNLADRLNTVQADPEALLQILGPYLRQPGVIFGVLVLVAGLVPLIEELIKPLGVWLLVGRRLSPAEGFVAGVLCGASFGLIESLFYLNSPAENTWAMLAVGRTGAILLHTVTTALVGWAMASAWSKTDERLPGSGLQQAPAQWSAYTRVGLAYLAAVILHGLWNGMAVLSSLPAITGRPTPGELLPGVSSLAPAGVVGLGALLLLLLWSINRRLRSQQVESETASNPTS